ncbi:serine/threonine-protein phosphatase PGAM5, mitochondrial-like isoform X2 [Littorina saxatilis]|uniref:Serine/threonine-protein phosphatase PGAM5, mitochondrial n=1 Tax=Littorina saxatilis TaxID=31220 RepID=A0AAN9FW54_9CAEN
MVWKTFQRLGRFVQSRQVGIITTSATVVVGLVLYERLKQERVVLADSRPSLSDSPRNPDLSNYTLSGNKTGIRWDENWDKRDPKSMVKPPKVETEESLKGYDEEVKKKTPKATRHLILIRHGQYVDTALIDEERILTALGREQAEITGQRLRDLDLDYTRMVSSTMARAVETADIIHKYLPGLQLDRDDILREGAPIKPEPYHSTWRPEVYFHQDGARIEAAFRKYFHRADAEQKGDSVEIIVCHANVIRYFACRALQFPPEAWLRISLAHTSLSHFMIRPSGRVILKSLGNSGHLPPTKVSYS